MNIREWRWPQWLIAISIALLFILGIVVIYVLRSPDVFTPAPISPTPSIPTTGLPQPPTGAPVYPPSAVEQIPLSAIQGLDTGKGPDLIAQGGSTYVNDITDVPVQHVTMTADGNLNYYDPSTKHFYQIQPDGTQIKTSNKIFAEVDKVVWANNSQDAILEFPDGSNILYNMETEEQITLPSHWQEFDFSPDSNKIAFKSIGLDPDSNWLAISDKTGGSTQKIANLGKNADIVNVDWSPNNQVVATYTRPDGLSRSELYFVGFNGENFPYSRLNGLNFQGQWSPEGKELLYSVSNQDSNFNPTLWLTSGSGSDIGQSRQILGLPTWADKCTFENDNIVYCGVPQELPRGAGLIPSIANDIPDSIVKIDLQTGKMTLTANPASNINVESINISEDGSQLFIHDKFTQQIKKINLK